MGRNRNGFFLSIASKRTTFGWLFFVLVAVSGRGGNLHILAGLPLIAAGTLLRVLSAGTIRKNEVLTTSGTYALCRHPLYLGSFLISAGFTVASLHPLLLLYFLILFPAAYIPAMLSEEDFLQKKFGASYEEYKKRVPLFLPKPAGVGMKDFSMRQALKNGEHLNVLAVIAVLGILLIKS